jgi:hypothetical protein
MENFSFISRLIKEFEARICVTSLYPISKYQNAIENGGMLLRTQSNHDFGKFLKDSEYMDLIGILLVQCNLNYHTLEIFKKLYGMHECDILLNEIKRAKGMLTYRWGEDGIEIYAPEFFIDIVIHPLSQFHSMVSMSYEQFVN